MRNALSYFLFSFVFTYMLDAQIPSQIDSLISTTSLRPFQGICVLAKKDRIYYAVNRGFANKENKTVFSPQTQFIVGSLSKQITAVLVLQASQKGLIDLHQPIKKYLPDLKEPWADSITTHQLLNHSSGVVGFGKALAFKAGEGFSYSNTGYALLGQIAASVSHESYQSLVNKLFKRCKMRHSAFPDSSNIAALATPYLRQTSGSVEAGKHSIYPDFVPAAGLMTTAEDLVKWNAMLHGGRLLNKEFYAKMITPSTTRNHPLFGDVPYGYALQMPKDAPREIGHGGYASGFISVNFYYPKEKISLIVLENLDWQSEDMKENFFFEAEIRSFLRAELRD